MKTTGLTENQLLDLLSGQLHAAFQQLQSQKPASEPLADLLPELGQVIAQAVAAAVSANNQRIAEQAERSGAEAAGSRADFYDHLSECIDGY